jgi:hypothetical protein
MDNTLVMYPNLQYNPIKIPDFTLLEIYKDTIDVSNGLGYCIIPIEGLSGQEIKDKARAKAEIVKPADKDNYILFADGGYDHKIIYAVWYSGDVPTLPAEPEVMELIPNQPHEVWHEVEVDNPAAPSFITVTLTLTAFDNVEFYINDDYFAIDIKKPVAGVNEVIINREGVSYNGKPIDSFKMTSAPKLKAGVNYIKAKCSNISNIGIKYRKKY